MLVAISGLAGSGKDTMADALVEAKHFTKISLADPLKRICMDVYKFSYEQLWGPSAMRNAPDRRYPRPAHEFANDLTTLTRTCKCCGYRIDAEEEPKEGCFLTPRYALQKLGTEWGRDAYPHTWVDYLVDTYKQLRTGLVVYDQQRGLIPKTRVEGKPLKVCVAVPDMRFKNEIDRFDELEAFLVRVRRAGQQLDAARSAHVSETEQLLIPDDKFHVVIENDKSLAAFMSKIDSCFSYIERLGESRPETKPLVL
jgi:hypothetical protein